MEKNSKKNKINNKKNIVLSCIILIIMFVATVSFAYAYFSVTVENKEKIKVNATTSSTNDTFITSGGTTLDLDVSNDKMQQESSSDEYTSNVTKDGKLSISIQAGSGTAECTYDIAISKSGKDEYVKTTGLGSMFEYTVQGKDDGYQLFNEINVDDAMNSSLSASNDPETGSKVTEGILGNYIITDRYDSGGTQSATVQNWDIKTIFYNLNKNQNSHENKVYSYDISIVNVNCINKGETYLVTYKVNGKKIYDEYVEKGKSVEDIPVVPEKDGYHAEWSNDGTKITKDIVITPKYYHLVTFESETIEGDNIADLSVSSYKVYEGETNNLTFSSDSISVGGKSIVSATIKDDYSEYSANGWVLDEDDTLYDEDNNSYEVLSDVKFIFDTSFACVLKGSKISMADGTVKNVENIKSGDLVLSYNYYDGTISPTKVYYVVSGYDNAKVFTVTLENGNVLQIADSETLFDTNKKEYIPINFKTYKDSIGKNVMVNNNGVIGSSKIVSITMDIKKVEHYTLYTKKTVNYIANNIVALAPTNFNNVRYIIGEDFKIDINKYNEDVEKYGTFSYSDLADVCTRETFDNFVLKDFKAFIEKNNISLEEFKDGIRELQEEADIYLK